MANALLSPKVYANVALAQLKNQLIASRMVSGEFKDEFKKKGDTVMVKRPPEFTIRKGPVVSIQDVVEGEMPVKIDQQAGVDFQFSSVEETLTVDALMKSRSMQAATETIAQEIDSVVIGRYVDIPNWVGTPGQVVDSANDFMLAPKRLDNLGVPVTGRFGLMGTNDHYGLVGNFTALPSQEGVANQALKEARLPRIGGVDPYMTQSMVNHTTGTRTNGTVAGAGQNKAYADVKSGFTQTLALAGLGANATIKAGDVFSIAGVYAVNHRSKQRQDFLAQFTVTTDAVADGAGAATVTIRNPIIAGGAYATVDAAPANGAVVTWMGAASTIYSQSLVLRKDAITLASAKLVMPYNGEASYSTDPETGISIRYWRFSDGVNDLHTHRLDVLYGVSTTDARQGARLSGTA